VRFEKRVGVLSPPDLSSRFGRRQSGFGKSLRSRIGRFPYCTIAKRAVTRFNTVA
jgi:hypothetical protein